MAQIRGASKWYEPAIPFCPLHGRAGVCICCYVEEVLELIRDYGEGDVGDRFFFQEIDNNVN